MFNHGLRGRRGGDNTGITGLSTAYVEAKSPQVTINGYFVSGTDDLALDVAGGQTIIVTGGGFATGITGTIGGVSIGAITYISPTQVSFTSPAKSGGLYVLVLTNSNGNTGALVPGIVYSSIPTFTTASGSIGTVYETTTYTKTVVATSDSALTYTLASGSLPPGATLNSSTGAISGTLGVIASGSTTYSFSITAIDAEQQDVTRSFTITTSTDVLTWVTPANGATIILDGSAYTQALNATDGAGYSVSYTANALPTGLTLSTGTISGTPTVEATTSTLLTATAATTGRSQTNTITWVVSLADSYWKYVPILVNAAPPTTSFINDASLTNAQLTIAGDTKPTVVNPFSVGYYSMSFNGASSIITMTPGTFGSADFTIEFWLFSNIDTSQIFFQNFRWYNGLTPGSISIYYTTNQFGMNLYTGGGSDYNAAPGASPMSATQSSIVNRWVHIAAGRYGATAFISVNGVYTTATLSSNTALNLESRTTYGLGGYNDNQGGPAWWASGYISNFRIVKGTALYTSNFTPPTSPFATTSQTSTLINSNRLIDGGYLNATLTPTNVAISPVHPFTTPTSLTVNTGYSVYMDGVTSGNYLTIASNAVFAMGSNSFTIECWFYTTSVSGTQVLIDMWNSGSTRFLLRLNTTSLQGYFNTTAAQNISGGTVAINVWNHAALVRNGTNFSLYLNGTSVGTPITDANAIAAGTTNVTIGGYPSSNYFGGYISNVRIVNGTAVYTANFTPSTTPLTAITNTVLLTCQADSVIKDNSTNNFAITVTGKPQVLNSTYPFTQPTATVSNLTTFGSTYFQNTGTSNTSWLSGPTLPTFGTQDHTIEFWMYMNASPQTYANPWSYYGAATQQATNNYYISVNPTSFSVGLGGGAANWLLSSLTATAPSINVWHHYALTRSGTTFRIFVDGVQVATQTGVSATISAPAGPMIIGTYAASAANGNYVQGYIADFRIVLGTALYTSNFAPSYQPLSAVTNTLLLTLQYNGGANNYGIVDNSRSNNVLTRYGNATQGAFSPYSQNGWSYYFASGNSLSMAANTSLNLGANDFTFECWINPATIVTGAGYGSLLGNGLGNLDIMVVPETSTTVAVGLSNYGYTQILNATSCGIVVGQWYHVVVTKSSNNWRIFINGVLRGYLGAYSYNVNFSGGTIALATEFIGYISNMRVSSGVLSAYSTSSTTTGTSIFTPPTAPLVATSSTLLLTCQSNRFIDNSPNNITYTITGSPSVQAISPFGGTTVTPITYSNLFNGSSDYLTIPTSNSLDFNTGDFTIEAWVYPNSLSSDWFIISASGSGGFFFGFSSTTTVGFGWGRTGSAWDYRVASSATVSTWQHVSVTRSGTSMRLFVNGVQQGTTQTISTAYNLGTTSTTIGSQGTNYYLNGYLSNIRVVKGSAVYTGNFTVPTSPLTITQSSGTNISALSIPNNGNSVYFNGSSDYLTIPGNSAFAFGTGDFTIEGWLYTGSTNIGFFDTRSGATGVTPLLYGTTGTVRYYINGADVITSGTVPTNTWVHIALVRISGSSKLYFNGTQTGSTYADSNNFTLTNTIYIGKTNDNGFYTTGYQSNMRVVKGVGVYTGNFTVPTSPLTATQSAGTNIAAITGTSTSLLTCQSTIFVDNSANNFVITVGSTATVNKVISPFGYAPSLLTCQTNTLIDNSNGSLTITTGGTPLVKIFNPFGQTTATQVTYSPSVHGGSLYLDGTGDYLTAVNSASFDLSSSKWTIECWFYQTSAKLVQLFSISAALWRMNVAADGSANFVFNTSSVMSAAAGTFPPLQWHHIATSYNADGTTSACRVFANGKLVSSGQFIPNADTTSLFYIGNNKDAAGAWDFNGYITDIRITRGVSYYYNSFYPNLTALPITSNTVFMANGVNGGVIDQHSTTVLETIGSAQLASEDPYSGNYYSNYFGGSSDYFTLPTAAATGFGGFNGNYTTIEFWAYQNTSSATNTNEVIGTYAAAAANGRWFIEIGNGAASAGAASKIFFQWTTSTSSVDNLTTTAVVPVQQWVHIAVVVNATGSAGTHTVNIYVNGTGQSFTSRDFSSQTVTYDRLRIGGNSSSYFGGYLSNLRVVRAVTNTVGYTGSSLTVPTSTFTTGTGTLLLTCQSNNFKDNSTNAFTLTASGVPAVKSFNPFRQNTNKSLVFVGGTYLPSRLDDINFGFGVGDFTVEIWIYPTATNSYLFFDTRRQTESKFNMQVTNSGAGVIVAISSTAVITSNTGAGLNRWTHVAAVKSSGTYTLYLNGVNSGSAANSTDLGTTGSFAMGTAGDSRGNASYDFKGYLADLRVTRGYARYTSAFTPPTFSLKTR